MLWDEDEDVETELTSPIDPYLRYVHKRSSDVHV
jgi:hypothetical protein